VLKTFHDFGIEIPHGRSGEVDVTCPQCSSQRKKKTARCLSVNVDLGTWHCHHCGWGGGLSQGEKRFDPAWRKPAYRKPAPLIARPIGRVEAWFKERGITADVLLRNQITETSVYMPQVEDHVGAMAFPYFRGDELVNVKYRDREKNFRMETGAERILYGLNDIEPKRCVIVEGEIDKLSVEVSGVVSCVSVPDGAPAENAKDYAGKFSFLEADSEAIANVEEWIIAVDNDGPGKRLEDELARRLGREKCKRVTWPSDCKDANDVLRSFGPEVLRECLEHAEPYPLAGVFSVLDVSDRVRHLRKHGWEKGVSTGWDEVDRFYTVRPGEVTVVTGIPNSGKSNWVDALLINLASIHDWKFALFSPENQPMEDHVARMVEKRARAPFADGPTPPMDDATFEQSMDWAKDHFTWILPDDEVEWTIDTVLDRAKALVFRQGIRGLVIDPWNELEHNRPEGMSETDYVSHALRRMRQFARHNGIHLFLVAHPTKLYRDKDGKYPIPTLYDISGSAHFRNKADNGICVWRDFKDDTACVEIHVQKIRFRQIGRIGLAKLRYLKPTASYRELSFGERA
jgi:twinkle protein